MAVPSPFWADETDPGSGRQRIPVDRRPEARLWLVAVALLLASLLLRWPSRASLVDDLAPEPARYRVDVNHADVAELACLPRVGLTLANRIVEERQRGGPFANARDLRRVNGIGELTLARIRDRVCFGPEDPSAPAVPKVEPGEAIEPAPEAEPAPDAASF